jgi:hypothetical protein
LELEIWNFSGAWSLELGVCSGCSLNNQLNKTLQAKADKHYIKTQAFGIKIP